MLNFNDKIFVSYPGGGAGDMFAASINGLEIQQNKSNAVSNIPFSIKHLEDQIAQGALTVSSAVIGMDFRYISTHLTTGLPNNSIKIVFSDSVLPTIIFRQMYLQKLSLKLNTGTFSNIIQHLCINQHWHKAAVVWLSFAEKLSFESNRIRQQTPGPCLDFSNLLNQNFVDSLIKQGWSEHIDLLRSNHDTWLRKQPLFTKELATESIANKLKTMDWSMTSGTVHYDPTS